MGQRFGTVSLRHRGRFIQVHAVARYKYESQKVLRKPHGGRPIDALVRPGNNGYSSLILHSLSQNFVRLHRG